ncbi:MAG TPA: ABC transporter permease subunit [Arthrobacter sp.]|nr:ABC transporter permease subunit [Arthrobacter sp.]
MNGSLVFARKEALEIVRTWRIWVLPSIIVFFALTGPPLARFTPDLINTLAGDQLGQFTLPPPTYLDSYGQWIKNLSQTVLFALIIIYGGLISAEVRNGTAVFVLTKPVTRAAFIIVKAVVHSLFLAVLLLAGTLITWGMTGAVFGEAPAPRVWESALLWLAFGVFFIALMTVLSVVIPAPAGAAGAGLGAYILLSIGAVWKPLSTYSPAGITGQASALAAGADISSPLWTVTASAVLSVALVWLAAALFRRKEL